MCYNTSNNLFVKVCMGLFRQLKDMFNKNIDCGSDFNDNVASLMFNKKYLYKNKNIFVKEKFACVVVYKGKVTDVIFSGKYRINPDSLPETFGRAKLNEKNNNLKKIRADLYCVRLDEYKRFPFQSDIPFKLKSKGFGRVKGCIEGDCTLKILDSAMVIKSLITDVGRIKTKYIPRKLGLIVGNKVNKIIQKNKIPTDGLLANQEYIESLINTEIDEALDKNGIFAYNIKLKAIKFPKKYQKKVNEYLSLNKRKISSFDTSSILKSEAGLAQRCEVLKTVNFIGTTNAMQINKKSNISNNNLICKHCHKQNSMNAKICINCGNKLF